MAEVEYWWQVALFVFVFCISIGGLFVVIEYLLRNNGYEWGLWVTFNVLMYLGISIFGITYMLETFGVFE